MAFQASLDIKCWKEHACSCCGTVYRYLFTRKKKGQGATEQAARDSATKAVSKALADEIEMRPCPTCGYYQPEMIGERRRTRLWIVFWIALTTLSVLLFLGAVGLMENLIPYFLALAGLLFGMCFLLLASGNPNRDLEANRDQAADYLDAGTMQVVKARDEDNEPPADIKGVGFLTSSLFCLLGILLMPAAEWLRLARGWTANTAWAPVVCGPGDSPWTFFDQHLECVKGYWNGSGTAQVINAGELGLANPVLPITARTDNWGNNISAKSSESRSNPRLWARVHLPADPSLAGKRLQLAITLNVSFPAPMGHNQFNNQLRTFNHATALVLASPGAGSTYTALWWVGGVGGTLLVLLGNFFLILIARAYRDQGLETRIVPLKKDKTREDEEEE